MGNTKLTIAIPTRNRKVCLEQCLILLAPQIIDGVELVVLDNHSDYDCEALVHSIIPSATVIRRSENIGGFQNQRAAATCGSGDYVWVLCDDDMPTSHAVRTILGHIRTFNPDLITSNLLIDKTAPNLHLYYDDPKVYVESCSKYAPRYLMSVGGWSQCVFRRSVFSAQVHRQETERGTTYPHFAAIWCGVNKGVTFSTMPLVTGLPVVEPPPDGIAYHGVADDHWAGCIRYLNHRFGMSIDERIMSKVYSRDAFWELARNPVRTIRRFSRALAVPGNIPRAIRRIWMGAFAR